MIYFKIIKNSETILSSFDSDDLKIESSARRIHRSFRDFDVELFATDQDYKLLSNKHIANKTIEAYSKIYQEIDLIKKEYNQEYTILSHNLVTSHSLLQDSLEQIVPEESLSNAEDHLEQINIVQETINADSYGAAESILSIKKRVVDLQAQIEGFKILRGGSKLDIGSHNIKKVLLNILYPFYEDFKQNNVEIRWHIDYEEVNKHPIKTDYKILNVALHHFLSNAVKYAKPYSYIDISFDPDMKILSFCMISSKIDEDELNRIFDLRYRGRNVKHIGTGEGVGMYMVKKAFDLLDVKIKIEPDYSVHGDGSNNTSYNLNKFLIEFPQ